MRRRPPTSRGQTGTRRRSSTTSSPERRPHEGAAVRAHRVLRRGLARSPPRRLGGSLRPRLSRDQGAGLWAGPAEAECGACRAPRHAVPPFPTSEGQSSLRVHIAPRRLLVHVRCATPLPPGRTRSEPATRTSSPAGSAPCCGSCRVAWPAATTCTCTTTRYDREAKQLDFLMVCAVCGTEKLVESISYEPRFQPNGATVHPLRPRRMGESGRRAA